MAMMTSKCLMYQFTYRYNIQELQLPLTATFCLQNFPGASYLDEGVQLCTIPHAADNCMFAQERAGYVRHTAASRSLKHRPRGHGYRDFVLEDVYPVPTKVLEPMKKPEATVPIWRRDAIVDSWIL